MVCLTGTPTFTARPATVAPGPRSRRSHISSDRLKLAELSQTNIRCLV